MTKLEKVLKKIREVNDLERLEFGCKVIMKHNVDGDFDVISAIYHGKDYSFELSLRGKKEFYPEDVVEIIGLPTHLEHLLNAITLVNYGFMADGRLIKERGNEVYDLEYYNLTKPVEQNLTDNPELLDLVAELLGVE